MRAHTFFFFFLWRGIWQYSLKFKNSHISWAENSISKNLYYVDSYHKYENIHCGIVL